MKAKFGIAKLDDFLNGGLDRDTINLIVGRSGIGKTILAAHWAAEGARAGENVVYLATTMPPKSCENYIGSFEFMKDVYDRIHWRFAEVDAKELMPLTREKLESSIRKLFEIELGDVDRFVLDSATCLDKSLADPVLYRKALRYIAGICYDNDITALFIEEAPIIGEWSEAKNMSECVIFLDMIKVPDGYARALRIIKKYRSSHPLDWIPYEITSKGIEIREGRYVRVNYEFYYEPG